MPLPLRRLLPLAILFGTFCGVPLAAQQRGDRATPTFREMASRAGTGATPELVTTRFHSTFTNDDYSLIVALPADYAKSAKRYKVLYLLDGNENAMLGGYMINRLAGEIDDVIVVSIGYAGALADGPGYPATQRWRDYPTPADSYWKVPAGEGAPQFYRTLTEEIVPYVDRRYRTDPTHRGLGGHSMGGFFSMWAMFHSKGVFDRYWISSPSLVWDKGELAREEAAYAQANADLNATVYADAGALEDVDMTDDLRALGERLQARGYPSLRWQYRSSPDLGHSGALVESAPYAFYALYGTPLGQLSGERLQALTGTYEVAPGQRFSIVTDGSSAFLIDSTVRSFPTKRARLLPTSDGNLTLRYVGLTFAAPPSDAPAVAITVRHAFAGSQRPELVGKRVR